MSALLSAVLHAAGHAHTVLSAATPVPSPADVVSAAPVVTPIPDVTSPSPGASGITPTTTTPTTVNLPPLVLTLFVWSSLIGALVVFFMPERTELHRARLRAVGMTAGGLVFIIALFTTFGQISIPTPGGGFAGDATSGLLENRRWLADFPFIGNYHLDADGISLPLMMLSAIVFVGALALMWKRRERLRHHIAALLIAETGVNGALCARDLLLILFFFGMTVLGTYLLIREPARALESDPARERAATRYAAFSLVALGMFVIGALLAVTQAAAAPIDPTAAATFDLAAVANQAFPTATAISGFALMFMAFLILAGGFPFHRWLIAVAGDADAGTAAVVVGIVSRLGGYAMLRIAVLAFPNVATTYSTAIAALAVVTTLWGAFGALVETDMRRMIAYVSLAETGAVLLGIAAVNTVGAVGSVVVLVVGGFTSTLLMLLAGSIEERTKHRSVHRLGGLALQMPRLAAFWAVVSLSVIGTPLLAGFSGDLILFSGTFAQHRWATVVTMVGLTLAGAALFWNFQRIFLGPAHELFSRVKDGTALEYAYMSLPLTFLVLYGVLPGRIMQLIANGVGVVTGNGRLGG